MRIGLILYGSLENVSGGFLYDRKLVDYLRSQGDHIELILLPWRDYLKHLGDNFSSELKERMRTLQVDVLLQDELIHPSLFIVNYLVRDEVSYPIVSIVHHLRVSEEHPGWLKWFYHWVEKRYLKSLDGMIFNSETTKEAVHELVEVYCPTIIASPAADHIDGEISPAEINQRVKRDGPLEIIFVGNVIPRKGLHTLIEAVSSADEGTFRLSVVGSLDADEGYARSIQEPVKASDWGQRVTFHEEVDEKKLKRLLHGSHVLVVPSSYEGFGIVYLEGMAFGLPAIGTHAGGAREIITSGLDGFLIAPGDAEGLLQYLSQLHHDRELLYEMSLAALRRYKKHPVWEQTGEKIRGYLQDVSE